MQVCVRTEEGIMEASPIFTESGSKSPKELDAIEKMSTDIQNYFIEISKSNAPKTVKRFLDEVNRRL